MRSSGLTGGLRLPAARFPAVTQRVFAATDGAWHGLWRCWQSLPAVPLRVEGRLAAGFIPAIDGALHLDGLLSAACFSLFRSLLRPEIERYVIPLPLALAWVSPELAPAKVLCPVRLARSSAGAR